MMPFWLMRPWLLARNFRPGARRIELERLERTEDPERFVWEVLPSAARTFAPCILLLPRQLARTTAVAYLYCRMLDTYEDLIPDPQVRVQALENFAARFEEGPNLTEAPPLVGAAPRDDEDRANALLLRRHARVDQVYRSLPGPFRARIGELVSEMAAEMRWASEVRREQNDVIRSDQLGRYCYGVLGTTIVFSVSCYLQARGRG